MSRSAARSHDPLGASPEPPAVPETSSESPRRAVRLDAALCQAATDAATGAHRSLPRQLEYWARLGQHLEARLGAVQAGDLLAGRRAIEAVSLISTARVDPDGVLADLERDRADGALAKAVSRGAAAVYDIDPAVPRLLRRTLADGSASHGTLIDGVFVETPVPDGPPQRAAPDETPATGTTARRG